MSLTDFLNSMIESGDTNEEFAKFREILEEFNSKEETYYTETYVANT